MLPSIRNIQFRFSFGTCDSRPVQHAQRRSDLSEADREKRAYRRRCVYWAQPPKGLDTCNLSERSSDAPSLSSTLSI